MTRILAFLRTVPLAIYLYAGGAVALAGGYALWKHHVAADAVAEAELAHLTVQHFQDSTESVRLVDQARRSDSAASALRVVYRADQAKDRATAQATDAVVSRLASARDSAWAVLKDSASTLTETRAVLSRVLLASDSAEAAHKSERMLTLRELAAAQRVIVADSITGEHATDAINALTRRALASEAQVATLKRLTPSTFGGWVKTLAIAGVAVEVGRLSAGRFP